MWCALSASDADPRMDPWLHARSDSLQLSAERARDVPHSPHVHLLPAGSHVQGERFGFFTAAVRWYFTALRPGARIATETRAHCLAFSQTYRCLAGLPVRVSVGLSIETATNPPNRHGHGALRRCPQMLPHQLHYITLLARPSDCATLGFLVVCRSPLLPELWTASQGRSLRAARSRPCTCCSCRTELAQKQSPRSKPPRSKTPHPKLPRSKPHRSKAASPKAASLKAASLTSRLAHEPPRSRAASL